MIRRPWLSTLSCISILSLGLLALGCSSSSTDSMSGPIPAVVPPPAPVAASTGVWSFAVMADTQWTGVPDDGQSPNTVAVGIINQLNAEFIKKNVKFVIQVGDVTDNGSNVALQTTARYRQALYNNNIGFFPLRGNHESSALAAAEFVRVFPQTQTGAQNSLPADVLALTTADDANTKPVAKTGSAFTLGTNFSSPTNLAGLSYSFDVNNVRFVLLDQFTPANAAVNTIDAQQTWLNTTLAGKPAGGHAFVFGHKGLITENHVDSLFGNNPALNPTGQDAFINSLASNGVRHYLGGHDHMHNRSLVTTTDGKASVQDIICASDSSKFYIPNTPSNDDFYNVPAFSRKRQTQLVQELNTIGYYIYTVDGPKVTVDYYSAVVNPTLASGEYLISATSIMTFTKRETFGYSLNGKEFVVAQGGAYTVVQDGIAKLLGGTNGFTLKDGSGRACAHAVDTGWTPKTSGLLTDILTLWGMANTFGSTQTDTYVVSLAYDVNLCSDYVATTGKVGVAIKGSTNWVNAINGNTGGTPKFVLGPYSASYGLGTYGMDIATHTAWAVVNFNGDFAVAPSI